MISLILIVAPIFLTIFVGKILCLTIVKDAYVWDGINKVAYWILFPAFLFTKMSKLDLSNPNILQYSFALIVAYFVVMAFAYIVGRLTNVSDPSLTSVIQGAARHNTFIGLAITSQIFGASGAIVGTVATVALVPLSNIMAVIMMSILLHKGTGKRKVIQDLVRNPIILSIAVGLIFNHFKLSQDFVLYQFTGLLAEASLPILLLVIGANMQFGYFRAHLLSAIISSIAKMLLFPLVTFLICRLFSLPSEMTVIAVIFATCPTSPAGFPLAKQMGGDASLMATIISLQTALAIVAIPIAISLAEAMM